MIVAATVWDWKCSWNFSFWQALQVLTFGLFLMSVIDFIWFSMYNGQENGKWVA